MNSLISCATGNFTSAATWGLVDATSMLDSETGNTALTTSYVESQEFTPGAIEVDGIAIKLASRAAGSPSNTISVRLADGGATVAGTEVLIDVADLDECSTTNNDGGWYLFEFASPVTLAGATPYTISAKLSATSTAVNIYRDGTAGNWSRMLRTTTTQAPIAADLWHVLGDHTGSGTGNDTTVTMDSTAATDYGAGTIGKRGILTWGVVAATDYVLRLSGELIVYSGAIYNQGTTGTPIPRGSTAWLEFDCTSNVEFGFVARAGTINMQFLSRSAGKNVSWCLLNTDEAADSTSLGVDTDTGWLDNDVIVVASTSQTYSECEIGALNGNAGAATLTVDGFAGAAGGVAYAHEGTDPVQAEVINLTRSGGIRSTSSDYMSYVYLGPSSITDIDFAEFYYLGANTDGKSLIQIGVIDGSHSINYCSFYSCAGYGVRAKTIGTYSAIKGGEFTNNVFYNCSAPAIINYDDTHVCDSNVFIYNTSAVSINSIGISFINNRFASNNNPSSSYASLAIYSWDKITAPWSGNVIHSSRYNGIILTGNSNSGLRDNAVGGFTIYRCGFSGVRIGLYACNNFDLFDLEIFGCVTQNIYIDEAINVTLRDCVLSGDTSYATTYGIMYGKINVITLDSCTLGVVGGIKTAHTRDIKCGNYTDISLINTLLASATDIYYLDYCNDTSQVFSQKHNQTVGNHKTWKKYGIITIDTTIYDTTPSARITPNNASYKVECKCAAVALDSGEDCTVSVKVRESVVGDGTDYNGSRIRLTAKRNVALGITADTLIATATVASEGAFETISGSLSGAGITTTDDGVVEFVVDCDGTTGWINFDTSTVS